MSADFLARKLTTRPTATWNPARGAWETDRTSLCGHSELFSESWPASGTTRAGSFYERPMWGHLTSEPGFSSSPGLLPTPRTNESNGVGAHGTGGMDLRTAVSLLPTIRATRGGSTTEIMYALGAEINTENRTQGEVVLNPGGNTRTPSDAGNGSSVGPRRRRPKSAPEARINSQPEQSNG